MKLNHAGKMVDQWYRELEKKFPDVKCYAHIIMQNHFHCIIENAVGVDLCVCPKTPKIEPILGEHTGSPLHEIGQWFKTMTTNEYIRNVKSNNWKRFDRKLWQRNYCEHIIRSEQSYEKISEYIINNPKKWNKDTFNGMGRSVCLPKKD